MIGSPNLDQVYLGQNYHTQRLITVGQPAGGTFRVHYRRNYTPTIAYNASLSTMQTAIRTLPDWEAAVVLDRGTSGGNTYWVIQANGDVSIVDLLRTTADGLSSGVLAYTFVDVEPYVTAPIAWKLDGSIRSGIVAALAGKTLIPGTSSERASQLVVGEWVIEDQLGGLGIRDYVEQERVDRFRDSSLSTFIRKQLMLGLLQYTPTFSGFTRLDGTTAVSSPDILLNTAEVNGTIYGWFLSYNVVDNVIAHLATFDTLTSTWTQKTLVSGGDGTDATKAVFRDARVSDSADLVIYDNNLWIFTGNTYVWKYDSSANTITASNLGSAGVISATVYDQKLVRLDLDGALYYTTDGTAWTASAVFMEATGTSPIGQMLCVRTWRNMKGTATVYVYHDRGLHTVDLYTSEITQHFSTSGVGDYVHPPHSVAFFQGDMYFIAGNRAMRYDLNSVTPYDVENDQGLPIESVIIGNTYPNTTKLNALFSTNQWLFACYRGELPAWQLGDAGLSELDFTTNLGAGGRTGMVLGHNGRGWHTIVPYEGAQLAGTEATEAWGTASWAQGYIFYRNGKYEKLQDFSVNPLAVQGQTYAATGSHITGWFDRGLSEIKKTVYHSTYRVRDISDTSVIRVYFQFEGAEDNAAIGPVGGDPHKYWIPLVDHDGAALVIDSTLVGASSGIVHGHFTHELLYDATTYANPGLPFYSMRLRFDMARDASAGHETETPILEAATVSMDAHFDPLMSFDFRATVAEVVNGRSSRRQIRDALRLLRADRLQFFSFTEDDYFQVHIDQIAIERVATGINPSPGDYRPIIGFRVSERMPSGSSA